MVGIVTVHTRAVDVQPELFVGPSFTSIGGTVYSGLGIGGGGSYTIFPSSLGPLEIRLAAMPVFGADLEKTFTLTQFHVPVTLALSLIELPRHRHGLGIGSAIGFGLTTTLGQLHDRAAVQPSAMIEVTLGMFQRGALTMRYHTTIADIASNARGPVGYNSLVLIASTAW